MAEAEMNPSFFARIVISFAAFFRALGSGAFAAHVQRFGRAAPALLNEGALKPPAATVASPTPTPPPVVLREASPDAALQLLGLLQREGRLIDFLEEDMSSFSDAEIGAAARVVHEGCRRALHEHFDLAPVRQESEGVEISLPEGFDAAAVRLTGNVVGRPPFRGSLQHRGWRATSVRLPKLAEAHDAAILAPAEVEL